MRINTYRRVEATVVKLFSAALLILLYCQLAMTQTPSPSPTPKPVVVGKPYTYKQCITTPGAKSIGYVNVAYTANGKPAKKRLGYCCSKCKRDIAARPEHWLAVAADWGK